MKRTQTLYSVKQWLFCQVESEVFAREIQYHALTAIYQLTMLHDRTEAWGEEVTSP